jgi:type VI secretion system protein ImpH
VESEIGAKANAVTQDLVEQRLRSEPWTFDFFQAVRLLGLLQPERSMIGRFSHPESEIVRVTAHPSLSFPASQIQSLEWKDGVQPSLSVNFLGLTGPLGVLPVPYTEMVIDRQRARDTALRDFLDLFNHRAASLFYQAWEKSRFIVGYERGGVDLFTQSALALLGLGMPQLRNRQPIRDESLLFYSGLFEMPTRPAVALEAILSDYFDVDVAIDQFIGVWRRLEESDCSHLQEGDPETYQLGKGAVVGDEIWDQQFRARIKIGPLSRAQYVEFLPTGSAFGPLKALTRSFCGDEIEFELQLLLRREEVPLSCLGVDESDGRPLGWLTWLNSKGDLGRDPSDTILLI